MRSLPTASLALLLATAIDAQAPSTRGTQSEGPRLAPPAFSSLRWRSIGPAIFGGRINDIEVARIAGQPDQIYVLPENGGVFKSTNEGASWTPVFDGVNSLMSMGDIAVAPSNPNIVWLGTGSGLNPTYYWGEGVYKSTDAGRTWSHVGLAETRHIGRIVVHPTNPDIAFVAASGRMWGPNPERGLFKTIDGGRSWKKVLYVDPNTGASDVLFEPGNAQVLYATTYQRQRTGYGGIGVGPGSGIHKSVDGGETWRKLTSGIPTQDKGRIGLTISPVDPKVVYADLEVGGAVYSGPSGEFGDCPPESRQANAVRGQFDAGEGGIYRTTDGGETWQQVYNRSDQPVGSFTQIRADPKDRNRLYREGTGFYVSEDMGQTFRPINSNLHGDYRSLWIDPDDPNHLIVGNDGGLGISWDRTVSWTYRNNLPIGEYWELTVDSRDPYLVCGGLQDNGIWCIPSAVRNRNGISNRDAFAVGGGDGMFFQIDPRDTNYAFIEVNSSSTANSIQRLSLANLQRQSARPGQVRPLSCLTEDPRSRARFVGSDSSYRWAWNTPIVFSKMTPGVVYAGGNVLFKSTNRGGSWTPISPDLTSRVNRDTIRVMGRAIGRVNYSPGGGPAANPSLSATFGSITWIGESPLDGRVIYTGSDDGQVQVTRDGGATWTNVTRNITGAPPFTFVSTVLPSAHVAGRVYATFDGHFNNDERAHVFVSNDFGRSWRAITTGLPLTSVFRIAEDPRDPNVLVVGHVRGAHFSNDAGARWQSLNTNMPTIPVRTVIFHPRDDALILGTYARGIWILDDVAPLRALTADRMQRGPQLVSVTKGRQWNVPSVLPIYGVAEYYAPNPELDPVISYYLRDAASGNATIRISDAQGSVVRTLSGPAASGLNRVTWDMHMDAANPDAPTGGRGGGRGSAQGAGGPLVLPGTYRVSIEIPGVAPPLRGDLTIQSDPRDARFKMADRMERQTAMMTVYGMQKELSRARSATDARLRAEVDRLIGVTGTLLRSLESFNAAPSADHRQQIAWARADLTRLTAAMSSSSQSGGRP
jgi:photosystem II stability/assembly factor-like uncharacterized protein